MRLGPPTSAWSSTSTAPPTPLSAYGLLSSEMLTGQRTLSVGDVAAEESRRMVEPVLAARSAGEVPLGEYSAGSPAPGHELTGCVSAAWVSVAWVSVAWASVAWASR